MTSDVHQEGTSLVVEHDRVGLGTAMSMREIAGGFLVNVHTFGFDAKSH